MTRPRLERSTLDLIDIPLADEEYNSTIDEDSKYNAGEIWWLLDNSLAVAGHALKIPSFVMITQPKFLYI